MPRESRPTSSRPVLVVDTRPRVSAPPYFPLALHWPSLRCWLGWHATPPYMHLVRTARGVVVQPPAVEWECPRCHRLIGTTQLADVADA